MPLDWTCETIRLSLFSTEAIRLSTEDWKSLTGQDEAEQEQKGAGRHVFAGPLFGGQLSLGAVANRCDCILNPITAPEQLREDFVPSVGQWPTPFESFQNATEPFLSSLRFPVSRMAFAATLLNPHKTSLEAYKALVTQVKSITHPPETLHDLIFRINWPTNSTADNVLTINRITTWSVQQLQLQIMIPDGNSPATFVDDLSYVVRLELDHNTDQKQTTPFDATRLLPIYKDLTNLALQNAAEGEVL
jgi:hypothetical protein